MRNTIPLLSSPQLDTILATLTRLALKYMNIQRRQAGCKEPEVVSASIQNVEFDERLTMNLTIIKQISAIQIIVMRSLYKIGMLSVLLQGKRR